MQVYTGTSGSSSNANSFTTTTPSYTTQYNVSQTTCGSNFPGFAPQDSGGVCSSGFGGYFALGQFSYADGVAYGEKATTSNGLTNKPITKVVISQIASDNNTFNGFGNNGAPSGTIGIKIVSSGGTLRYTFTSTYTASSSNWNQLCNANCSGGGGNGTLNGWTNITLIDTGNTYTMIAGDIIFITWSGTGGNVVMIGCNSGGVYGAGMRQVYAGTIYTDTGKDLAATLYSSS
jgi:hypothetical protein